MSIEVRPVGVTCNLRCTYCYEQPIRDVSPTLKYNKAAVFAQIESSTGNWSLFGGEALILPIEEIEELLKLGYEKWKSTGIQTNGTLITPAHVDLFEKYHTHVGISLDGPDDLNDSRWAGTLDATRKATARTFAAIDMLLERSFATNNLRLIPSLIITLHAGNASVTAWPRMKAWLSELDSRGIRNVNFHVMELDYKATKDSEWYLPHARMKEVMLDLWELSTTFQNIQIVNFREITELLRGKDERVMCVWHACDPWNTAAVQGLEGDGSPSHCTRTNKDGIDWLPAEGWGKETYWQIGKFDKTNRAHERQLSLYVTPQEHGGCKGCRFWSLCLGQCPGTAEESVEGKYGDWRLRSTYCQTWKDLFEEGERRLLELGERPISLQPIRPKMEQAMYQAWTEGREIYLREAIDRAEGRVPRQRDANGHGDLHGDHYDGPRRPITYHGDHADGTDHIDFTPHGDHTNTAKLYRSEPKITTQNHEDVPHGDEHGDEHGDHHDGAAASLNIPHGDEHSDSHGDEHMDHVDESLASRKHHDQHADHDDTLNPLSHAVVVSEPITHGDQPHGDHHADHVDEGIRKYSA